MKTTPSRYRFGRVFALMAIAISIFGVSGSALAEVVAFDSYATPKQVGNDISIADWNRLGETMNGISYDSSSGNANWGFGTTAVGTHTIATGAGISVGGILDVTGLTSLNGGLTIETGDTFTYGGQALTTISTGVADNGALVTQGYVDDATLWQESAGIISPTTATNSRISITNNSDSTLTGLSAINTNDIHNYAGAMIEVKGSGAAFTNNMFLGKYGAAYYVTQWAGDAVIASDKSLNIMSASDISFQGGIYTAPVEIMNLNSSGLTFATGVRVNSILDEDDMVSDSATALASQQSIKAYVDGATSSPELTAGVDSTANSSVDPPVTACTSGNVGALSYVEDATSNEGSFWGCSRTGTATYVWTALSIFSE